MIDFPTFNSYEVSPHTLMFLLFIDHLIPNNILYLLVHFSQFDFHMESILSKSTHLVITGDFNVHFNDTHDIKKIIDILKSFG